MDNRARLKKQICAYDFAIVEVNLYLDTHPCDKAALCLLQMYLEKREILIENYESQFGPYVQTVKDVQGDAFTWICDPWPWEYCREA